MPISPAQRQQLDAYLAGLNAPDIFAPGAGHVGHEARKVPDISHASQFVAANGSGRGPAQGWHGEGGLGLRHGILASYRGYTCAIPLRILTMHQDRTIAPTAHSAYLDRIAGTNTTIHLTIVGMAAPSFYGAGYIRSLHDLGELRCAVGLVGGFNPWPVLQLPTLDYYHRPLRDFGAAGGAAPPLFPPVTEALPGPRTPHTAGQYFSLSPQFLRDMVALAVFAKNNSQTVPPGGEPSPCPIALLTNTPVTGPIPTPYSVREGNAEIVRTVSHLTQADHKRQADPYKLQDPQIVADIAQVKAAHIVNSPLESNAVVFHCAWGWGRTGTIISAFLLIDIFYHMSNAHPDILEFYFEETQNSPDHLRIGHVHLPQGAILCTPLVAYVVNKQRQDVLTNTGHRSRILETASQLECLMTFESLLLQNRHLFRDVGVGGVVASPSPPSVLPPAPAMPAGAASSGSFSFLGPSVRSSPSSVSTQLPSVLPPPLAGSPQLSFVLPPPLAGGPQLPSVLPPALAGGPQLPSVLPPPYASVSRPSQQRAAIEQIYHELVAEMGGGHGLLAGEQAVFNLIEPYFNPINVIDTLGDSDLQFVQELCLYNLRQDARNPITPPQRMPLLNRLLHILGYGAGGWRSF